MSGPIPPMLYKMAAGRVFSITDDDRGGFEIMERCDDYFIVRVSAAELRQLGQEIIALAEARLNK